MSKAANNSLVNEIADITECSICTGVFQEPRCLPCAHTFCLGCLEVYGKDRKPSNKALCPMCRKAFTLPAGGWKNLPRNYIVEKLLSTYPGRSAVKCSSWEGTALSVEYLTKSVTLQIDSFQQLADQLKEHAAHLSRKSQDVKQDIVRHRDELKSLVDDSAAELLTRLDHLTGSTMQKLAAEQRAVETKCSQLRAIQTKLIGTSSADDPKHHLEMIAGEMKPLMVEAKCDVIDADISFTEAQLPAFPNVNLVGSVALSNTAQTTNTSPMVWPKLLHTLNPSANVDAVIGLGVINDVVYVVRSWTTNVELYSATSLKPMTPIQVLTLDLPHDMVACTLQKCLYLSDYGSDIHRIEVSGYCMQTKWNAGDRPTGLSLTTGAANVMVTYEYGQKVREYTSRGELLREISLPTEVLNPHQSLLLSSGQLLACHGFESDAVNRVCLLDVPTTKVLRAVGAPASSAAGQTVYQLMQPIRVAVSETQGVMYVADFKNDRVLVVSLATLAVQSVLTSGGIRRPYRLCLDDSGLLYVGSWETGQVLVYNTCSL